MGGGLEKAAHFPTGVHEIAAAPLTAAHIPAGVLVEGGTDVIPQGVVVHRKMDGYKVQNHSDVRLMAPVHQGHELLGGTVAGGGAEKAGVLIAPGGVAGMLADGHEFNVVKARLFHIGDEPLGDLLIVEPAVGVIRVGAPGAQVYLVDVDRAASAVGAAAHPALIPEGVGGEVLENGGIVGTQLHKEAVGVTMVQPAAVGTVDAIFIFHPRLGLGDDPLPKVSVVYLGHGQLFPVAELPNEGDLLSAGGKGAEHCTIPGEVGAQIMIGVKGAAGIKSIKIHGVLLK